MSTDADQPKPEQRHAGLFDEQELPIPAARSEEVASGASAAVRVMSPQRDQVELRACDLDSLLPPDHPTRTVGAFAQSLDLAPLYARIKAVQGGAGRPAIDPAILGCGPPSTAWAPRVRSTACASATTPTATAAAGRR